MNQHDQFRQAQWKAFLGKWTEDFLRLTADLPDLESFFRSYSYLKEPFGRRSLGLPGASQDQIEATELRLGTVFPDDYVDFLCVADGWVSPGFLNGGYLVSPTADIDLFSLRNAASLDILLEGREYAEGLESAFLRRTLQISDDYDRAILLYDPLGGRRLFWHHDFHGESRSFASFTEMIQYIRPRAAGDYAEVIEMYLEKRDGPA
jgi:hypothetical protein